MRVSRKRIRTPSTISMMWSDREDFVWWRPLSLTSGCSPTKPSVGRRRMVLLTVHGAVSCIVDLHEYEQSIDMIHQGEDLRRTFGAGQEKTDKITYV